MRRERTLRFAYRAIALSAISLATGCDSAKDSSELAERNFRDGNMEAAVAYASAGLLEDSSAVFLLGLRSRAFIELDRYREAILDLSELLIISGDSSLMSDLGDCYFGLDSFNVALTHYNAALDFDTTLISGWQGRAKTHAQLGKCDWAAQDFERASGTTGVDATALNTVGLCYERIGDLANAEKCLGQAIDLDGFNWVLHYNLSSVAWKLGDTIEALTLNQNALRLTRDHDDLLFRERGKMVYFVMGPDSACALWSRSNDLGDHEAASLRTKYCLADEH